MKICQITEEYKSQWLGMRQNLYSDLDIEFHEKEISWILSSDQFQCYVVEIDNKDIVGFIELSLRNIVDGCVGGPVGYIEGIYVELEYRNKGYGKLMIEAAINWFKEQGCAKIATDTEVENKEAQRYFNHLGFKEKWHIVQFLKDIDS